MLILPKSLKPTDSIDKKQIYYTLIQRIIRKVEPLDFPSPAADSHFGFALQ